MTEAERPLHYAEAQANHPDPQLRPLFAAIFGPDLPRLRAAVEQEKAEGEGRAEDRR